MDLTNSSDAYTLGELRDADDHNSRRRTDAHSNRTAYSHSNHRDDGHSRSGHTRGHNIRGDIHAYNVHSRPAPCPRTLTSLCLGIDEPIEELCTVLLLPKEWLQ